MKSKIGVIATLFLTLTHCGAGENQDDTGTQDTEAVVNASSHVVTIKPGDDVASAMASLSAGDTLRLRPGEYEIRGSTLNIDVARGTTARRITMTAFDIKQPPRIVGAFRLKNPDFWTVSHIHFTGAAFPVSLRDGGIADVVEASVAIFGGTGWVLEHNEIDGARQTGSLTNLGIDNAKDGTTPTNYRVSYNCIHDAAHASDPAKMGRYHNLYISSYGNSSADGGHAIIGRNIFYGAEDGANIKLMAGDGLTDVDRNGSPAGVVVRYNTLYDANFGIEVGGWESHGNRVVGNLITHARSVHGLGLFGVKIDSLNEKDALFVADNYVADITDEGHAYSQGGTSTETWTNGGNNSPLPKATNQNAEEPPWFDSASCGGFHPGESAEYRKVHPDNTPPAARFGVYSKVEYSTLP